MRNPLLSIDTVPALILRAPTITELGGWQLAGGGVSPVITISLRPSADLVAKLDPPPLRVRARLFLDADDSAPRFAGVIQSVTLGPKPSITLET